MKIQELKKMVAEIPSSFDDDEFRIILGDTEVFVDLDENQTALTIMFSSEELNEEVARREEEKYDEGLADGFDRNCDQSYDDGYDEGYDKGSEEAYDKGYDAGLRERESS